MSLYMFAVRRKWSNACKTPVQACVDACGVVICPLLLALLKKKMTWVCLSNGIERKTHILTLNMYFKKESMGDMIQNWLFRRMTLMCGGRARRSTFWGGGHL